MNGNFQNHFQPHMKVKLASLLCQKDDFSPKIHPSSYLTNSPKKKTLGSFILGRVIPLKLVQNFPLNTFKHLVCDKDWFATHFLHIGFVSREKKRKKGKRICKKMTKFKNFNIYSICLRGDSFYPSQFHNFLTSFE